EREQALDIRQSFIVQAPAGSGKTEILTQRYLNLLSHSTTAPESIIALTFTNKAANEMHHRIYSALLSVANPPPGEAHKQKTYTLAKKALKNSDKHHWNLLKNPRRLRIMTIDAFCQLLSNRLIYEAEDALNAEVTDKPERLYQDTIDKFISSTYSTSPWKASLETVLLHLDNNLERFKALFSSMLAKREQWLGILFELDLTQKPHSKHAKEKLEAGFQSIINSLLSSLYPVLVEMNEHILCEILRYCHPKATFQLSSHYDTLDSWQALIKLLFTDKGQFRSVFNKSIGLPATDPQAKSYATWLKNFTKNFSDSEKAYIEEYIKEISNFKCHSFTENQWEVLQAISEVALYLAQFLRLCFKEKSTIDFNEVSLQALSALGQSESPTDLALYLDHQIQHLLIDEFQDTSIIQFKLLELLTCQWQRNDGKTLFIVGDPMQSIYRFRQAEVNLFLDVKEYGIGLIKPTFISLSCNFRSSQIMVEWFNRTFSVILPAKDIKTYGAIAYSTSDTLSSAHEKNSISLAYFDSAEAEAYGIAKAIKDFQQTNPAGSIAILVRSRSHLKTLIPILKSQKIELTESEIEPLYYQEQIQDLIALSFILINYEDIFHWLSLLQSKLFGFTLEEIDNIQTQSGDFFLERAHDYLDSLIEPQAHQIKLRYFLDYLNNALYHPKRTAIDKKLSFFWQKLDGCSIHPEKEAYHNFIDILDQHLNQDRTDILDHTLFLSALESSFYSTDKETPIKVMTIHKSKGLEFDFVIMPDLNKASRSDDPEVFLYDNYHLSPTENHLLVSPIRHALESEVSSLYKVIQSLQKKRALYESQRLLYVGATRAKSKLFLTFNHKEDGKTLKAKSGSFYALLEPATVDWEKINDEQKDQCKHTSEAATDCIMPTVDQVQTFSLSPFAINEPEEDAQIDKENPLNQPNPDDVLLNTDKQIGSILHACFEYLCYNKYDQHALNTFLNKMCYQFHLPRVLYDKAHSLCHQAITNTIKEFPWIFTAKGKAEQNMYQKRFGKVNKKTADRIIEKDGEYSIIDYKFSTPLKDESLDQFIAEHNMLYQGQLREYQYLLAAKQRIAKKSIKLFLYYPLIPHLAQLPNHAGEEER
ncbi:UvrD-helicase domain-containing protein, partial [Fangia hongkongensis]